MSPGEQPADSAVRTGSDRQPVPAREVRRKESPGATRRPPSEVGPAPGVPSAEIDGLAGFVRHRAWLTAPVVQIEVDSDRDLLTVRCYAGLPDVEVDPSPALSVGFDQHVEEYLLTSLALFGVSGWSGVGCEEVSTARRLLGERVSAAVAERAAGGRAVVHLEVEEARELAECWCRFVADSTGGKPPPGHRATSTDML
jgi:hypothetical protein